MDPINSIYLSMQADRLCAYQVSEKSCLMNESKEHSVIGPVAARVVGVVVLPFANLADAAIYCVSGVVVGVIGIPVTLWNHTVAHWTQQKVLENLEFHFAALFLSFMVDHLGQIILMTVGIFCDPSQVFNGLNVGRILDHDFSSVRKKTEMFAENTSRQASKESEPSQKEGLPLSVENSKPVKEDLLERKIEQLEKLFERFEKIRKKRTEALASKRVAKVKLAEELQKLEEKLNEVEKYHNKLKTLQEKKPNGGEEISPIPAGSSLAPSTEVLPSQEPLNQRRLPTPDLLQDSRNNLRKTTPEKDVERVAESTDRSLEDTLRSWKMRMWECEKKTLQGIENGSEEKGDQTYHLLKAKQEKARNELLRLQLAETVKQEDPSFVADQIRKGYQIAEIGVSDLKKLLTGIELYWEGVITKFALLVVNRDLKIRYPEVFNKDNNPKKKGIEKIDDIQKEINSLGNDIRELEEKYDEDKQNRQLKSTRDKMNCLTVCLSLIENLRDSNEDECKEAVLQRIDDFAREKNVDSKEVRKTFGISKEFSLQKIEDKLGKKLAVYDRNIQPMESKIFKCHKKKKTVQILKRRLEELISLRNQLRPPIPGKSVSISTVEITSVRVTSEDRALISGEFSDEELKVALEKAEETKLTLAQLKTEIELARKFVYEGKTCSQEIMERVIHILEYTEEW